MYPRLRLFKSSKKARGCGLVLINASSFSIELVYELFCLSLKKSYTIYFDRLLIESISFHETIVRLEKKLMEISYQGKAFVAGEYLPKVNWCGTKRNNKIIITNNNNFFYIK